MYVSYLTFSLPGRFATGSEGDSPRSGLLINRSSIPVNPEAGAVTAAAHNRILEALPEPERATIRQIGKQVELPGGRNLLRADEKFSALYFAETAVFSLVTDTKNANSVESGTIGNEGFLGLPVFLGSDSCPQRVLVQIPGKACEVPVDKFREVIDTLPELKKLLTRYSLAYISQVSQTAACNSQHTVTQRLGRWILLAYDRVGGGEVQVTQESLASMLGVRRPSVTIVQAKLKKRKLIDYTRGRIRVLDPAGIEAIACECHYVVRREFAKLVEGAAN